MSNSFKATSKQINDIVNYYQSYAIAANNINIHFKARIEKCSVIIYSNGTVLFQGQNANIEYRKWQNNNENEQILSHIGSDEVGCGDYFGPIVVCAAFVKDTDYYYLKSIGVKDSKQLNDKMIVEMASLIKSKIQYATFTLTNKKYNELYNKNYNLNKIKAYLHNYVLYNLTKKVNFNKKVVVDQFCSQDLYYKYLADYKTKEIVNNIQFETKAENKYLAVACASIIARDLFLNEIANMKQETGYDILLGANSKVDDLAKKMLEQHNLDYMKNYVKLNFKNTQKILN